MENNIIYSTDSYKASHWLQYPPNTTSMFSYVESRGGVFDKTTFFGLQYYLRKYLSLGVSHEQVVRAKHFFHAHGLPFNEEGWTYIATTLKGKIPVRIRAVPEGAVVPNSNALVTVESTDPKVFWIVSWLETAILRAVWYPTTVCTLSWHMKQIIKKYMDDTACCPTTDIMFKLHDFGSRGVSSSESAAIGGAAHLVNFMGSDNVEGILLANDYYLCAMAGFSIPAMEHSSVTSWGEKNEVDSYRNMLKHFGKPGALVACVSDSYNIYNACEHLWGEQLKAELLKSGAIVVIRPDSGEPSEVVIKVMAILDSKFGHTVNSKGYRVLNNVRVIQGDGINVQYIPILLEAVKKAGYSIENLAMGMGGGLLQQINRDTQKFAYKCSSVTVDGKDRDVFKNPVTDTGKSSKKGRLTLHRDNGVYKTCQLGSKPVLGYESDALETVFENGKILKEYTLEQVRANALHVPTLF